MLEEEKKNYLLELEKLIDPRERENKIHRDCLTILFEKNKKPDDSDIPLLIKDICITLDKDLEKATLFYREQNGITYTNDKTKEVKQKPIEYKRLNVSIMRICIMKSKGKRDYRNYRIFQKNLTLNYLANS